MVSYHSAFARGAYKKVYEGRYTEGERSGHPAVVKFARAEFVQEDLFWQDDLRAIAKAEEIMRSKILPPHDRCGAYFVAFFLS